MGVLILQIGGNLNGKGGEEMRILFFIILFLFFSVSSYCNEIDYQDFEYNCAQDYDFYHKSNTSWMHIEHNAMCGSLWELRKQIEDLKLIVNEAKK